MWDLLLGSHRPTGCMMFSKALILSTWHVILKLKTSHVQDTFQEHSVQNPLRRRIPVSFSGSLAHA